MWGGNEAGRICDSTVDSDWIQDNTQTILSTPETVSIRISPVHDGSESDYLAVMNSLACFSSLV